jgi:hypothetical protein
LNFVVHRSAFGGAVTGASRFLASSPNFQSPLCIIDRKSLGPTRFSDARRAWRTSALPEGNEGLGKEDGLRSVEVRGLW